MTTLRQRPHSFGDDFGAQPLDAIDRRIVTELVNGARMSNRQLADRIGVAPSTALVRTQSLIDRGVITGFSADVDLSSIGRPMQALVAVRLNAHNRHQDRAFAMTMSRLPEVVATFHTAGSVDYLFHVALPTTSALRDWVLDHLTGNEAVRQVETTLVFKHVAGNPAMLPA
jgi:DNA-binding Lrp family transcriptional regulator